MRHSFLYFLQDENYNFYSVENGVLSLGSDPKPLIFSPQGWQEISIQCIRNSKYFGLDRNITIPYAFVEDGADILKSIVYTYGIEKTVYLSILELNLVINSGTYGYIHKMLFRGEVDLSTFNHAAFKVTCTMLDNGLLKYFKANENTTYEIPLNVPEAIKVKMDGIFIHSSVEYLTNDGFEPGGTYARGSHIVGLDKIVSEPTNIDGIKSSTRLQVINTGSALKATNNWFYKAVNAGTVEFDYDFEITTAFTGSGVVPGPAAQYQVQIAKVDNASVKTNTAIFAIPAGSLSSAFNRTVRITGTTTLTVNPGDEVYLFTVPFNYSSSIDLQITNYNTTGNFFFNAKFRYRKPFTYALALRPSYLFQQLINKVTEGRYLVDATGLLTDESDKVFTSGDGIRGIENAVIKISLSDFYGFWQTWKDAGITLKDRKVSMQTKANMLDYSTVSSLGQISQPVITVATEYKFNTLKIGYPDKQVEGINGKQAFNNIFEWSLGTKKVTSSLDLVCKINADCYAQEIIRITFDGKNTTDSKLDNDTCVLHINKIESAPNEFELNRSYIATGLLEPESVYNIGISPKRCLLNNGSYFRSAMQEGILKFTSSSKNNDMVSAQVGQAPVIEKLDVNIVTLADSYFKPFFLEIETAGYEDLLIELAANPLRLFSFTLNNNEYIGIPFKVGVEPSTRKAQTFKLLCGKDTDLRKLITYNG